MKLVVGQMLYKKYNFLWKSEIFQNCIHEHSAAKWAKILTEISNLLPWIFFTLIIDTMNEVDQRGANCDKKRSEEKISGC